MSVHWERAKLFPNRGCDGCSKISCVHHGSRRSNKQPPVDKHGNELPVPDGDRNGCNTLKGWTLVNFLWAKTPAQVGRRSVR